MRLIALIPVFSAIGCYAYVSPQPGSSLVGAPVRLALTDSGATTLAYLVGTSLSAVEGRLAADSQATYVVQVDHIVRPDGVALRRRGEQMLIPHALVEGVGTRRLSRGRTAWAGAAATAAGVVALLAISRSGGAHVAGTTGGRRPTPN